MKNILNKLEQSILEDKNKKHSISVYLEKNTKDKIDLIAKKYKLSRTELINKILIEVINEYEEKMNIAENKNIGGGG